MEMWKYGNIRKNGNLEIWKSGNRGIWKHRNMEIIMWQM